MSDTPIELIVAAFNDENAADEAMKELKQAKKQHLIGIKDAAVIRRDQKNKLHIKEIHDMGGGKGAGIGAIVGGAIGILTGPGILLAGAAGAVIGGLAAKMSDGGFPDNRLKEIGAGLKPGTSAIVAVIEHIWVDALEAELAEAGAQVITQSIADDIATQLEAGKDLSYSAVSTADALDITRTAVGEDEAEISEIVLAEGTVIAQSAVVNAEGVAYEGMLATEDGIAYEAMTATEDGAVLEGFVATEEGVVAGVITATVEEDASDAEADEDEEEVVEGEVAADEASADDETSAQELLFVGS